MSRLKSNATKMIGAHRSVAVVPGGMCTKKRHRRPSFDAVKKSAVNYLGKKGLLRSKFGGGA